MGLEYSAVQWNRQKRIYDFWLANLTAPVWKTLHMRVYVAYGLLVLHVTFGVLQAEVHPLYVVLVSVGLATVLGLHLAAALKDGSLDREVPGTGISTSRRPAPRRRHSSRRSRRSTCA